MSMKQSRMSIYYLSDVAYDVRDFAIARGEAFDIWSKYKKIIPISFMLSQERR